MKKFLLFLLCMGLITAHAQMDKRLSIGVFTGVRGLYDRDYGNDTTYIFPLSKALARYPNKSSYNTIDINFVLPIYKGLSLETGARFTNLRHLTEIMIPSTGEVFFINSSENLWSASLKLQYAFFRDCKYQMLIGMRYEYRRARYAPSIGMGFGFNLGMYHAFSKHHGIALNLETNFRDNFQYKYFTSGTGLSLNYYFLGTKWFWEYDKARKE